MNWYGRPGAPVIQALYWLGKPCAVDPQTASILRDLLPDYVKQDLVEGVSGLSDWMIPIIDSVARPLASRPGQVEADAA